MIRLQKYELPAKKIAGGRKNRTKGRNDCGHAEYKAKRGEKGIAGRKKSLQSDAMEKDRQLTYGDALELEGAQAMEAAS